MSIEKPWAKPYGRLLDALLEEWGGEATGYDRRSMADVYLYPEYRFEIESRAVRLHVTEFPGGARRWEEASDNIEYLRVLVPGKTGHTIRISPETFGVRVSKFFGATKEFETGDPGFDRKYLLKAEGPEDEKRLSDSGFQAAVSALDPFALLTVDPEYLLVSRPIRRAADLEPAAVRELVRATLGLFRLLG